MNNLLSEKIFKDYEREDKIFSQDASYRKALACAIGLNIDHSYKLRPIIGVSELNNLVKNLKEKNFMPGARHDLAEVDSHDNLYIKSGEFCANMHIHTLYSDGRLTVDDFLSQAVELAEKNIEKGNNKPVLVAVTDHDCIDGAKEVLVKVSQNPIKYKNVRIVLGVELSTITNQFNNLKKPLLIHTHMFCINPFDNLLNEFIDRKRALKLKLAKETVEKLNQALKPVLARFNMVFTLEEAAQIHELVTKGQDEVYLPMKKYTGGKLLFTRYVLFDNNIKFVLEEAGIDVSSLSYDVPYQKYKFLFKQGGGYSENYKKALNVWLCELVKQKTGEVVDFSDIISQKDEQVENSIQLALEISKKSHPNLTEMPEAFDGFEDTLKLLSGLDYGVFSIAHPGRTMVSDVESDLSSLFDNMFGSFKKYAAEKACYYEGYYQSYSGEKYLQYLPHIDKMAEKYGLIKVGGLDSHGESITCRGGNP